MLTVSQTIAASISTGLSLGIYHSAGPITISVAGTLGQPAILLSCGVVSSLSWVYSTMFIVITGKYDRQFTEQLEIRPPAYTIYLWYDCIAAIPPTIITLVSTTVPDMNLLQEQQGIDVG